MSGWTEREKGSVKVKHYSTSSSIEMTVTSEEEIEQGRMGAVTQTVWFDYGTFEDLIDLIRKTDFD